jgi:hypothetical protein
MPPRRLGYLYLPIFLCTGKKEAKVLTEYQKRRLKDDLPRKGTLRAREQSGLKNWT